MKPIHYNQNKIKEQTKKQFDQWYDEFKKFILIKNIPSYHLDFYYSKEHCTSCCIHPEDPINGIHIINVNELLLLTYGQNAKSIAYHEFTHIYDSAYFYKLFGKCKRENITLPYSEYHASQNQMMCAFNMKSIHDDKIVNMSDRVYDGLLTKRFTVQSYIKYINNDLTQTIDYYYSTKCTVPIESRFIDILRHITYYFGIIDTLSRHIINKSYIENKYDYIANTVGADVQILHDKLKSFNSANLQDYCFLYELWIQIGIKITNTLKDKLQE